MAVVVDVTDKGHLGNLLEFFLVGELGGEQVLEVNQQQRQNQTCQQGQCQRNHTFGADWRVLGIGVVHNLALGRGGSKNEGVFLAFLQQEGVEGILDTLLTVQLACFTFLAGHLVQVA